MCCHSLGINVLGLGWALPSGENRRLDKLFGPALCLVGTWRQHLDQRIEVQQREQRDSETGNDEHEVEITK